MVFTFCWSIDIKVYVQNIVIFINEHCHLVPNTAWAVSGYSEAKLWSVWNAPWFIFVGAPALNWKRPLSWKKWMSVAVTLLFLNALWSSLCLALLSLTPLFLSPSSSTFGTPCSLILLSFTSRELVLPGVKIPMKCLHIHGEIEASPLIWITNLMTH